MVFRGGAFHRALRLVAERIVEPPHACAVDVALHPRERHRGSAGNVPRERRRFIVKRVAHHHPLRDAQREAALGRHALTREVQELRLGRTDEALQQPGTAVVACQADIAKAGGHESPLGHQPHVTGQGDGHARARSRPRQGRDRRSREVRKAERERLLATYKLAHGLVSTHGRPVTARIPHAANIAAGAECRARAGDDEHAHARIARQHVERLPQGRRQRVRKRVAPLGAIERERRDAILCQRSEQFARSGLERLEHGLPPQIDFMTQLIVWQH